MRILSRNPNRPRHAKVSHKRISTAIFGRRLLSGVLCLCMLISVLSGIGVLFPWSAYAFGQSGPTLGVIREADPSTMDTYIDELNLLNSTRYAGRLWTDKTVFAAGQPFSDDYGRVFNGNQLTLTSKLDGKDYTIDLDSDFLHCYSVMSSSQGWVGVPPVRAVLVFDNSGSMYNSKSGGAWEEQRIAITIEAINRAIDTLMEASIYNEVSVVMFGDGANSAHTTDDNNTHPYNGHNTAVTILPMAHYKQDKGSDGYTPYLTAGWNAVMNGAEPDRAKVVGGGFVYVNNNLTGLKKGGYNAEKKYENGYQSCGDCDYTAYSNGTTNVQAGYAAGMKELLNATKTQKIGAEVFNCVPALVMLTDGEATDMVDSTFSGAFVDGKLNKSIGYSNMASNKLRSFIGYAGHKNKEIWNLWDMFVEKVGDNYQLIGGQDTVGDNKQPAETGKKAMIELAEDFKETQTNMLASTLMTAAYGKAAVEKAYNRTCNIYTLSVDMKDPNDLEATDIQDAIETDGFLPTKSPLDISNAFASMNPQLCLSNEWLSQVGYFTGDAPKNGEGNNNNTIYPDYSFGGLIVESIGDAIDLLQRWKDGEEIQKDYIVWQEISNIIKDMKDGKMGDETTLSGTATDPGSNVPGHSNGYFVSERPTVTYPQLKPNDADNNPYGLTNADVLNNINYVKTAYYVSTGTTGAETLATVFDSIAQLIAISVFEPVQGENNLNTEDSVTYMDPLGKYMEVKDVNGLLLFGNFYKTVQSAVYDYTFNERWLQAHTDVVTFPDGWYYGDDPADPINADGPQTKLKTDDTGGSYPDRDGITSPADAWAKGWKYRLSYSVAQQYVPSLKSTPRDQISEKQQKTYYTFYRLDLPTAERNKLRMNPAYGTKPPEGVNDSNYKTFGGVYKLNDIRIWVEDTQDFNDTLVDSTDGLMSDANFDRAFMVDVPVGALPMRTVTIDVSKGSVDDCEYTTNMKEGDDGYIATFPLRIFYSVGVESDILTADNNIDIAKVSSEYIKNNKIASNAAETVRKLELNDVEFFANWYNPGNRYNAYAITGTDYSYGDPVVSFSPARGNTYYLFEKPIPLYSRAFIYVEADKQWRTVKLTEDLANEDDDVREFNPMNFDGEVIAFDLEATATGNIAENTKAINDALTALRIKQQNDGAVVAPPTEDGCIVLLNGDRLKNVDYTAEEYNADDDPFASSKYFYMAYEYYELSPSDGTAIKRHYIVGRKGSEFGSAYEASGITNGDMLCWYDESGTYEQIYPYFSRTETGDNTRGRHYIGMPLDADGNYVGAGEHGLPSGEPNAEALEIQRTGQWTIAAKPGGLQVGSLAQKVAEKTFGDNGAYYFGSEDDPDYKQYLEYVAERFPNQPSGFSIGYYGGNTTRTANNYFLPTISTQSSIEGNDVIVNVYLGNNGRLIVNDTTLLMTKQVVSPEGAIIDVGRNFDFQAYIEDWTGPHDAIVMAYNEATGIWQRQLHYIDLELDGKLFLQNTDGTKVLVDSDGCRLYQSTFDPETNAPVYEYVEDCTVETASGTLTHKKDDLYTREDGPYYVFIGTNAFSETEIGASATAFRVYHNYLHNNTTVDEGDVICEFFDGDGNLVDDQFDSDYVGERNFYAASVWLFTAEQYEDFTLNDSWEKDDGSPNYTPSGSVSGTLKKLEKFFLLTLHPDEGTGQGQQIQSEYLTQSAFLNQTVYFGYKSEIADWLEANPDKTYADAPPEYKLTADDLYDSRAVADNTAGYTLPGGYGLLFAGMTRETDYILAEHITADDWEAGYSFVKAEQTPNPGEPTDVRVIKERETGSVAGKTGVLEEAAHFTNTYIPDALIVSKVLEGVNGTPITEADRQKDFTFRVSFLLPAEGDVPARYLTSPVYYWTGKTADLAKAPTPNTDAVKELPTLSPEKNRRTYEFTLKADESIVFYSLPIETKYTVTEQEHPNYPIGESDTYTVENTVKRTEFETDWTATSPNKVLFTNTKPAGILTVEKQVENTTPDPNKDFQFTVKLTPPSTGGASPENLVVERFAPDGTVSAETLAWNIADGTWTAECTLHHNEKISISKIPIGTEYTVSEAYDEDYRLQRTEDGSGNLIPTDSSSSARFDRDTLSVTGTVPEADNVYLRFVNAPPLLPPFAGGLGWTAMYILGVLLLTVPLIAVIVYRRRRRSM